MADLQAQYQVLAQKQNAKADAPIRLVYAPKKLPDFKGVPEQNITEWVRQARDAVKLQKLQGKEAADFLKAHLSGAAATELKYANTTDNPEDIFTYLKGIFGEARTAEELLDIFVARRQKEKESLLDYSHALMTLLDKAVAKDPLCVPDKDKALKTRFAENIRETKLRADVKKTKREHTDWTFQQLREEALTLARESKEVRRSAFAEVQQLESDVMPALCQPQYVSSGSPQGAASLDEIAELRKQMSQILTLQRQQQELLSQQQKSITELQHGSECANKGVESERNPSDTRKQAKGPCTHCGRMGHIRKYCYKLRDEKRRQSERQDTVGHGPPMPAMPSGAPGWAGYYAPPPAMTVPVAPAAATSAVSQIQPGYVAAAGAPVFVPQNAPQTALQTQTPSNSRPAQL